MATRAQPLTDKADKPLSADGIGKLLTLGDSLSPQDTDEEWHRVRIMAKRRRYAADAVGNKELARALAGVQNLLGEHQDAAVAAETWLSFGDDPQLAVTAGRLFERERARIVEVRAAFPDAWSTVKDALEAA
jgi:CHAD domain-containing protein